MSGLSYSEVGATAPAESTWYPPPDFRIFEKTIVLGDRSIWGQASADLMGWKVKTRSGFAVEAGYGVRDRVVVGEGLWLVAKLGPFKVREPIRVIETVSTIDRVGYSYGTRQGHPVTGEEAFVIHRSDDHVCLTVRSLTRPGGGIWRLAFPLILIAQRCYRRRYLRSLIV